MRQPNYYFNVLYFLLIISCVFAFIVVANCFKSDDESKIQIFNSNDFSLVPSGDSTLRSLKTFEGDTDIGNKDEKKIIVVSEDGTVYFVEYDSGEVLWQFSSGSPTYSKYLALLGDGHDKGNTFGLDGETKSHFNYIHADVTNEGNLVWYGLNDTAKMGLPKTLEEFFHHGAYMVNGQVILGSKKSSVTVVDAITGRILSTHTLDNSPANVEGKGDEHFGNLIESTAADWKLIQPMYVTRIDYFLQSSVLGKCIFNLSYSQFLVAFPSKRLESPSDRGSRSLKYEGGYKMPLPSPKSAIVPLIHVHNDAEGFLRTPYKQLPNSKHGGEVVPKLGGRALPGPNSDMNMPNDDKSSHYSNRWKDVLWWLPYIFGPGVAILSLVVTRHRKSTEQLHDPREKHTAVSKRKKARRLGNSKNSANAEKSNKVIEEGETTNGLQFSGRNDNESSLDLTKPINGSSAGRKIGKLFVSNIEIAKGSNGTIVLEGNYEGRPVAIKRLVKAHHDVAVKEIQNLIASDQHPNIVRWYGVECDSDFVYLSLERCMCSLNDLIQICSASSQSSVFVEDQSANSINEYNVRLDSMQGIDKDIELWKANGYPSPQLLNMMRDVVSGLAHLHELGIIHRDLKPQNVLILKQRSLCAKVSDMGLSKRLIGDMSSLGHHATGSGSSGWQAPEQLLLGRQTRAVDLFSLGCVIFFCITGGKHPFGDRLERDINIVKNHVDLFMVEHIPEAVDLLSHLLDPDPELRPKAVDVLHHPLFWDSEMRLSFLRDTSDRVELEDRESESDLLKALESVAPAALGGKWDEKMETTFIANIGRYRRYKFDSLRDLLRVVRNKLNHYRELPKDIQELLGAVPEGFDGYFASRFPRFLIEVYKVMFKFCREEECFSKYFKSNQS